MSPLNVNNADSRNNYFTLYDGNNTGIYWDIGDFRHWWGYSLQIMHAVSRAYVDSHGGAVGPVYTCQQGDNATSDWYHWEVDIWGRIISRNSAGVYKCIYSDMRMIDYRTLNVDDLHQYWILRGSYIINKCTGGYLYSAIDSGNGTMSAPALNMSYDKYYRWIVRPTRNSSFSSYITLTSNDYKPTNIRRHAYIRNMTRKVFAHGYDLGVFTYLVGAEFMIKNLYRDMYLDHCRSKAAYGGGEFCIYQYQLSSGDQTYTINNDGILVPYIRQDWCIDIYYSGENNNNHIQMNKIAYLNYYDARHIWGFDGIGIFLARDPTLFIDDGDCTTNYYPLYIRRNITGCWGRSWKLIFMSSTNTIPITRGVSDTNNKFYKVVGCEYNHHKYNFTHHKSSEISSVYKNNTWTYGKT